MLSASSKHKEIYYGLSSETNLDSCRDTAKEHHLSRARATVWCAAIWNEQGGHEGFSSQHASDHQDFLSGQSSDHGELMIDP